MVDIVTKLSNQVPVQEAVLETGMVQVQKIVRIDPVVVTIDHEGFPDLFSGLSSVPARGEHIGLHISGRHWLDIIAGRVVIL